MSAMSTRDCNTTKHAFYIARPFTMLNSAPMEPRRNLKPKTPANRRREKKQLSCEYCRHRKIKCDRRQPCGACTSRGLRCSFLRDASSLSLLSPPSISSEPSLASLEERIKSLENIALPAASLMKRSQAQTSATFTETRRAPPAKMSAPEIQTIHKSKECTAHADCPQWAAVIDGISELKDHVEHNNLHCNQEQELPSLPNRSLLLLYSFSRPPSKEHLISELPVRSDVDHLVFQYFSETSILPLNILHPAMFLRQYESFWANPSAMPIQWIGLLYSIMCLSVLFGIKSKQERTDELGSHDICTQPKYLEQVVHCLLRGDYIRGGPHIIETLLHYVLIESALLPYSEPAAWTLLGLTAQIALRMGYHRDPCHFPEINTIEGEMRRRHWAVLHICDTTLSVIGGIPRTISEGTWDTRPPANVDDANFDLNCTSLPRSRPDSEVTPVSLLRARYALSLSMGPLIDARTCRDLRSVAQIRRAEPRILAAWDSIPARFKFTSLAQCLSESPATIAQRLSITCVYNKMLIMLHMCSLLGSPQWPPAEGVLITEHDADYETYSRQTCIEAALKNLEYLALLDAEARPGGTLASLKDRISTLALHEFLVATAVLGTFLYRLSASSAESDAITSVDVPLIERALRQSKDSWVRWSASSHDAKRAVDMLELLFNKLEGNSATESPNAFSMILDGMGLNFDWDAESLECFYDGMTSVLAP